MNDSYLLRAILLMLIDIRNATREQGTKPVVIDQVLAAVGKIDWRIK